MRRVLLTLLFLAAAGPAWATTYYMGPASPPDGWSPGRDTNAGLSKASPKLTLAGAFAAMRGGDTLVIADGTYTGTLNVIHTTQKPPSGSPGAYTVIRAEHEGAVTFDGEEVRQMFGVHDGPFSYLEFRGLKWVSTLLTDDSAVVWLNDNSGAVDVHHVKFFRCGAMAATGAFPRIRTTWGISGGHYLLFEECYAWGSARYAWNIAGPWTLQGQANGAKYVILRRCVVRMDDVNARVSTHYEPASPIHCYACSDLELQNNVMIDMDVSYWEANQIGVGISTRYPTELMEPSERIFLRGNVQLNILGWKKFPLQSQYGPSLNIVNSTATGADTNHIEHGVLWDVMNGIGTGDLGRPVAGSPSYDHMTIMLAAPPAPDETQQAAYLAYRWTLKNSVITGHPYYGVVQVNGVPGEPNVFVDYTTIYGTDHDYSTWADYVVKGSHNHSATDGNAIDPLDGIPGNGTPGLRYILRQEAGSDLWGTGENGANRGATIVKRYGASGTLWGEPGYNTLTDEDLWPFPHEAQIRADMRAYVPSGGRSAPASDRGFCADGQTLTNYIWGYLGHAVPPLGLAATPGERSVTLSWARPADMALPTISGFNIYRVEGGLHTLVGTVYGNAIYTATVSGLEPSVPHVFAMTTVDVHKGESGYSEIVTATPAPGAGGEPATPTVTWATPASIVEGAALSGSQLNATASVPGTFAYAPAAGTVLAVGTHTLTATFTPTDTRRYTTATASVSLVVSAVPPTTPTVTWAAPASVVEGTALSGTQLNATASVPGTFAYSPASGTALAVGTHTLTATFTPTDTRRYTTATASVSLVVSPAPPTTPTVTWAAPASVVEGTALGAAQLNATASVPGTFAYSPPAGTVLSTGTHTLTATFTPTDAGHYTTATASVSLVVSAAPPTTPTVTWSTPASVVEGTALSGTQLNATASVAGTFAYSPAAGTVLSPGSHILTATFTPTDAGHYTAATASVSLAVSAAPPTTPAVIWVTPASVFEGTALSGSQLNATASVPGTFAYSPAAGTVLSPGSHILTATFTPTDAGHYTTATASVSLVVIAALPTTPTVTWATPASVVEGTALSGTQLNATAGVAGTFAYSPAAGTMLSPGSHILTATFTPTDTRRYTTATASVSLVVSTLPPATPAVTWFAPASVVEGTALSGIQLNATASVPGTFAYSPAAGTVLAVGSHILTATFIPVDATRYTTATASVSLVVSAAPPPASATSAPAEPGRSGARAQPPTAPHTMPIIPGVGPSPVAKGRLPRSAQPGLPPETVPANTLSTPVAVEEAEPMGAAQPILLSPSLPAITWATPAAITEGQALSGTQLGATASVLGTFAYLPTAGTVLAAGTHILSATFTPVDTTRYATATASVTLTVTANSAGAFVGPITGGAWSGRVVGHNLVYGGVSYPIADGIVAFPDCTSYFVAPNGDLTRGAPSPASCSQASTGTAQGTGAASSAFAGPVNGGGWKGKLRDGQLVYNGVSYPIVDGMVTFPDCTTYLVAFNGSLLRARPSASSCSSH